MDTFFSAYPVKSVAKGQILISAHDEPEHIIQLVDGRVKQYDISHRGDEVVLNIFKPPAYFPMSYAINRLPNQYFFEAETDLKVRLVPLDEAVGFVRKYPEVAFDLLSRVYRGLDGLLGRLAHLMAGTARSRVLYELLIEARRFGEPNGAVDLNETDIAARAGLARETVSREMVKLKDEGLITVSKNRITILNIDDLAISLSRDL